MTISRWPPDDDELAAFGDNTEAEEIVAARKATGTGILTRAEQLPAIPDDGDLYLTWDADYSAGVDRPKTVIRHGEEVLFIEPASWQAIDDRYEQICRMVKERYGSRVRDLVPTADSFMWLYGDIISGPILRAGIRDEVFGSGKE